MKYAGYGLGFHFYYSTKEKPELLEDIVVLCDKNPNKWGKELFGKPVISPSELANRKKEFDGVIVFSADYFSEIRRELTETYGFAEQDIRVHMPADKYYQMKMEYISHYQSLPESALEDARLLTNREAALKHMPKNAICCEVGVAYGDFSQLILQDMQPRKFYAIDYFSQHDPYAPILGKFDFKMDNMPHQQWYENRFKDEISAGQIEVRQGFSWDVLAEFPDDYFDYIYLDAAHDYESVCKDIDVLQHKVKSGGYMQFNDYCAYFPFNCNSGYFMGVIPAVNKWINKTEQLRITAKVKYLCMNPYNKMDIVVQLFKK